jgi:hypothetical protein
MPPNDKTGPVDGGPVRDTAWALGAEPILGQPPVGRWTR